MTFEELLEHDGHIAYTNKGSSMMPLIREGRDVMIIQRKPPEGCRKLDAVLFVRPGVSGRGHYVLHRVLQVNGDGTYWIVGDNCVSGETVAEENVIGVLTSLTRNGRSITPDTPAYRLYVNTWCRFYPIRFLILRCLHLGSAVLRRCRRVLKRSQ